MREIKFEIYSNVEQRMLSFEEIKGYTLEEISRHPSKREYTGLKDKNGKEIYEGDIANITYTCMRFSHFMRVTDRGEMQWNNLAAQYSFLIKNSILNEEMKDLDIEVIGNIYENPELLKGGE